jgi:hypothetical protein
MKDNVVTHRTLAVLTAALIVVSAPPITRAHRRSYRSRRQRRIATIPWRFRSWLSRNSLRPTRLLLASGVATSSLGLGALNDSYNNFQRRFTFSSSHSHSTSLTVSGFSM